MEVLTHGVTHVLRPDILGLLIGLAVFITLLALAGLILQVMGSARDARRFPPPGQLVDVGGHRLHIYASMRAPIRATLWAWCSLIPSIQANGLT
jgi:hypothetical protein